MKVKGILTLSPVKEIVGRGQIRLTSDESRDQFFKGGQSSSTRLKASIHGCCVDTGPINMRRGRFEGKSSER